ncbi:hypothetical protein LIER_20684 [Lithospermum erythrorhizon]|uniref:Retrovirus-related Pol polyprotein from transposon TNT 1-94-like beta-barrel domain-containing protein n=1 Tax=Lithospermum erythrorhizon TaxID=34254 RepID=A0AAV3QPS1_LITER
MMFYLTTSNLQWLLVEEPPIVQDDVIWSVAAIVDGKLVEDQVRELEIIFHKIHVKGMVLSEMFKVATIIEKSPPSLKDFKNYLNHKQKDMNMEQLSIRLEIEEGNRKARIVSIYPNSSVGESKANVVEVVASSKSFKGNKKRDFSPSRNTFKKSGSTSHGNVVKAFDGLCCNCNKIGHKSFQCRQPKRSNNGKVVANVVSKKSDEINIQGSLCYLQATMYMANNTTSNIEREGTVVLKMTSGKEVTLKNVLYVPELRKNLVSGSLNRKHGFKFIIESDKIVLTKSGMFVGKCYVLDGLFKMNVMVMNTMNKTNVAYVCEYSNFGIVD